MNFLDDEEKMRINVFDWNAEFKDIMSAGGFDVVIGNPPYVFGGVYGIEDFEKKYFTQKYFSGKGKVNLFAIFIEKSLEILSNSGYQAFIIPNTILRVTSYKYVREMLLNRNNIIEILDLGSGVFKGATTSSIILTFSGNFNIENKIAIKTSIDGLLHYADQNDFINSNSVISIKTESSSIPILNKLKNESINLGSICKEMIFGVVITKNKDEVVFNKYKKGSKPFLEGKDISRYYIKPVEKYLDYIPSKLHRPRTPEIFEVNEKIIIQRITGGNTPLKATIDTKQFYNKESLNNIILKADTPYSLYFILGLLNSKLINWFYKITFTNESNLTVNLSKTYLSQIPIKNIFESNQDLINHHNSLATKASSMIELQIKFASAKTPTERTAIERQIQATDAQIDQLVYQLYGLTEEEIKIVEQS